jgi:hypothetical protein
MDGTQEPRKAPECAWCAAPATRTLLLRRAKGKLPKTAPVCENHWQHFHSLDEIGERAEGESW